MLEFENQIFLDVFQEDGLLIMSRGLGINRLFSEFLKVYSDPASLVLVLNTTPPDESYFIELLEKQGISNPPKIITNQISASERQLTYAQGGVLFITSRILVVDLLTDRVPVEHITGIMVFKAHKIIESCQEAFILRLYRQKNKTGFIKAFTDNPEAYTSGFCHVERMMKNLHVKKLYLWPRFHASVVSTFKTHKVNVVEIHQTMTPAMTACQTSLLDLINACVNELKRSNPSIDTDEITVENALSKSFETIIRLQLEPVWHQLSSRTRQLVTDLKTLRLILKHLTQYDSVAFYCLVQSIRTSEKLFGQNSGWLFLDSADSLYMQAKQRVYGQIKCSMASNKKKDNDENSEDDAEVSNGLEQCPKWQALTEILDEIKQEEDECVEVTAPGPSNELHKPDTRILICAEDDRTCNQIKEYLCEGGDQLMQKLFRKFVSMKKGSKQPKQNEDKTGKMKEKEIKKNNKPSKEDPISLTLTQMMKTTKEDPIDGKNGNEPLTASTETFGGLVLSPMTIIHPLHGCSDPYGLSRILEELQPKYVILYDADISLVRQLEVFKATRPGQQLRVYFMIYKESVEEQRYLTALRKEKEAFEFLIREKATMVISEEQDGKSENSSTLTRDVGHKASSSRSGGIETHETQKIIVDMREFRSELPSLIHRRGIEIEPVTLEVGDYILTPEICVERKSISDLIGSLNNGRLYQQALSMCRFYKKPMVLIEFDTNKPFALQIKSTLSSDVSLQDISTKLAILTMQFPKLRLLWCPSPYASAELFDELKGHAGSSRTMTVDPKKQPNGQFFPSFGSCHWSWDAGRPQPNAEMAMTVTAASSEMPDWTDKYNHGPQDFVLRMPGINSKNYHCILNKFTNLYDVSQASLEHLIQVLGSSSHAQQLYDFLHKEHKLPSEADVVTAAETKKNWKGKSKGFYGKGKGIKRKK